MILKEYKGSLFDSKADILAHQVNCQRTMGSGIAKIVRDEYPKVYEDYKNYHGILGDILVSQDNGKTIANLYGQFYYKGCEIPGDDESVWMNYKYTDYEALYRSLERLKTYMSTHDLKSVAFPYRMGSSLAGGNWEIVFCLITAVFKNTDYTVEIWEL